MYMTLMVLVSEYSAVCSLDLRDNTQNKLPSFTDFNVRDIKSTQSSVREKFR